MSNSSVRKSASSLSGWARLLRIPNLFTVPGDAVAGYALASKGSLSLDVLWVVVAILFTYMGGLILNDYFDSDEDARERPDRPIPSGAVAARSALCAGFFLLAAGVGLAFLGGGAGLGLVVSIVAVMTVLYDSALKKVWYLGFILMGGCRAGSVLAGATLAGAATGAWPLIAAFITFGYTSAITWIAKDETKKQQAPISVFFPSIVLLGGVMLFYIVFSLWKPISLIALVLFIVAFIESLWKSFSVYRGKQPLPPFIGSLIRIMILTQAAWTMSMMSNGKVGSVVVALALFAMLRLCSEVSGRWFYGS